MSVELTTKHPENSVAWRNLVTFRLGQQTCALPIEPIVQIIPMVTITRIPQVNHTVKGPALSADVPSAVEGVINVRGATVPVVL